jgi:hypothetical protein
VQGNPEGSLKDEEPLYASLCGGGLGSNDHPQEPSDRHSQDPQEENGLVRAISRNQGLESVCVLPTQGQSTGEGRKLSGSTQRQSRDPSRHPSYVSQQPSRWEPSRSISESRQESTPRKNAQTQWLQGINLRRDLVYGPNPPRQLPARGQLQIQESRELSPLTLGDARNILSLLFECTEGVVNGNSLVIDHLNSIFSKIVQALCQEVSGPVTSVVEKLHSSSQINFSTLNDTHQSLLLSFNRIQSTFDSISPVSQLEPHVSSVEETCKELKKWESKLDNIEKVCVKNFPTKFLETHFETAISKVLDGQKSETIPLLQQLANNQSLRDVEKLVQVVQMLDARVQALHLGDGPPEVSISACGSPEHVQHHKCQCIECLEKRFDLLE